ncbi:uncharacterized protein LOC115757119 [Rhodamnia argentea]|uniref:Uncharacterized protein LOC115757119 n=1 Tax=Rhodamnia argentea TaxID=178133 RepID=A0A8B8R0T1_9MYRT|nr:uncharacterized protein LOC115757119 [Rhodamnia argentea]
MNLVPSSDGASLATAMAVSGTLILFAIGFQKSYSTTRGIVDHIAEFSDPDIPSCTISGATKKKKKIKREKARRSVHFEEDVAGPDCYNEEFEIRRDGNNENDSKINDYRSSSSTKSKSSSKFGGMPANRAALYEAVLRDRIRHRVASCYR